MNCFLCEADLNRFLRRSAWASALTAGGMSWLLVTLFHLNRGMNTAAMIATGYSFLSALIAWTVVYLTLKRRSKAQRVPIFGAKIGAGLAYLVLVVMITIHTSFFPGTGGFLINVIPILILGTIYFGWMVILAGAFVGYQCEKRRVRVVPAE